MGRLLKQQRGMTLMELLAVIVILGIVAAIAIPSIGNIIEKSKDQAFVANAVAMKEAATLHKRSYEVVTDSVKEKLTYEELLEGGYIDTILDPFTKEEWTAKKDDQKSFVDLRFEDGRVKYYVCLNGATKSLCGPDGKGILSTDLSVDQLLPSK